MALKCFFLLYILSLFQSPHFLCAFSFFFGWFVFFFRSFEFVVVYHTIKALTALSFTTDIISPYQNQYSLSTCLALFVHKKSTWFSFFFAFHFTSSTTEILNYSNFFRNPVAIAKQIGESRTID